VLTRRAATKSALTRTGELFRVIHVAAHGEFVSDQPLDSRLLLAPEAGDDGRLTAGDLYGLRLNADLVTLSACETGLGKVLSGDDVIGLTRGFLYAGANSIVASLWPVSDEETSFLMVRLYGNLKTMPKADALRQAQLETKRRYAHPFFWSAFQLTGMGR
jgi:CHAT domain-containing protein